MSATNEQLMEELRLLEEKIEQTVKRGDHVQHEDRVRLTELHARVRSAQTSLTEGRVLKG